MKQKNRNKHLKDRKRMSEKLQPSLMQEKKVRLNDFRSKSQFVTINEKVRSEMETIESHTKKIEIEHEKIKLEKGRSFKKDSVLQKEVT